MDEEDLRLQARFRDQYTRGGRGTRRWLAETIRARMPVPVLIDIAAASGDGVVRVTVAPADEGTALSAASVAIFGEQLGEEMPMVARLELTAMTFGEMLRAVGARTVLDWMIRRGRSKRGGG